MAMNVKDRILSWLSSQGGNGATDEEIAKATELNPSTVRPRRKELLDEGWVIDMGKTRKTDGGKGATVWVAKTDLIAEPAIKLPTMTKDEERLFDELDAVVSRGIEAVYEAGDALIRIKEERLYRKAYRTFEEYCEQKKDIGRRTAYRWIEIACARKRLRVSHGTQKYPSLTSPETEPENPRQWREILALPEENQGQVWDAVCERVESTGEKKSANLIREVAQEILAEERQAGKKSRHGLQPAYDAIACLKKYDNDDPFRLQAYQIVSDFIKTDKKRRV